jgi:hypothetical protein
MTPFEVIIAEAFSALGADSFLASKLICNADHDRASGSRNMYTTLTFGYHL